MKNIIVLICCVFFFIACDIINPEEQVPAFLRVEKMELDASAYFSSNSENIADVWVYVDDEPIGAYELPAEIPLLAEGSTKLKLIPGIYKDGIKSHRHFYSYYTQFDTVLNFFAEQTTTIKPQIRYLNNFELIFNEDFEGINFDFEEGENSDSTLIRTGSLVVDGTKSGILYAPKAGAHMEIVSKNEFQGLNRTLPTYLEIDYMSTVEFTIGVIADNGQRASELILRPNLDRRKIYVDLTGEMNAFAKETMFKVYFEATSVKAEDYILLDNIRLLTPKN